MPTGIWRVRPPSTRPIFSPAFTTSTSASVEMPMPTALRPFTRISVCGGSAYPRSTRAMSPSRYCLPEEEMSNWLEMSPRSL